MSAADAAADAAAQAAAAEPPASTTPPAADAADAAAAADVAELASLDLGDEAAGDEGDAAGASAATKAEAAAHRDAAIVKQVEFYFSDANLPTDEFMLGKIRGNKSGWAKSDNAFAPVSLHTIVRFNKMKRLCKGDAAVAAAALRSASTALEVDPSGGSVRRLAPLPASDPLEIGSRTVVAENLPSGGADGAPTAASLDALFAKAGRVRMLRVCPPTASGATGGRSTLQSAAAEDPWGALNVVSTQTHALVEYETRGEALAAVAQLNDGTNWRTGLRVRLVRREGPAFARNKAVEAVPAKGASATEGGAAAAAADGAEGWEAAESGAEPPAGEAGGEGSGVAPKTHKAGAKGGKKEKAPKRDYAAWASAGAHRETQQRERAAAAAAAEAWGPDAPGEAAAAPTAASSAAEPASSDGAVRPVRRFAPPSGAAAAAPGGGPAVREAAMPDGTRGFTRGRGRPLASPFAA